MGWLFGFFFISGFCSILYEVIWLRLAMADFGVTTAMVSTVLSMFMAGLGLGSWVGGRLARRGVKFPALRLYALTELLIGFSALAVPFELGIGRDLLRSLASSSSFEYYLLSGICVGLTLVPWCFCLGATIPFAMLAVRSSYQKESRRSFSFLYTANTIGAATGATVPVFLIELYGFHKTLIIGATLNFLLAASASIIALRGRWAAPSLVVEAPPQSSLAPASPRRLLVLLFSTGFCSMALEVVWVRQFTPYLGTVVYAFAAILGLYLLSTFAGAWLYRLWSRVERPPNELLWVALGLAVLLPLLTTDPFRDFHDAMRLILGIVPFTLLLGILTPMLVDYCSGGDPEKAGAAYAVNVVGCIFGPLISGFVLLPLISERWVTLVFALPWFAVGMFSRPSRAQEGSLGLPAKSSAGISRTLSIVGRAALALIAVAIVVHSSGFEDQFAKRVVRRDDTATVVAMGEGMGKRLWVNGVGMTALTPITKMMAHLPLALLDHSPRSALAICFGMGTSHRSLMSWNIPSTAVELVPSVPTLFAYYHADAPQLLASPLSHIVIDDGRRFLERTQQRFDVILIDPPPPVEAAGSSLLYSEEFYAAAKRRLQPGGILQQWLPAGDPYLRSSVTRALTDSFPYVRAFGSLKGWGNHFLASTHPIPMRTAAEMAEALPPGARKDLLEWGPKATAEEQFAAVLSTEIPPSSLIAESPRAPALQDDRPTNEYYVLRRAFSGPGPWPRWPRRP